MTHPTERSPISGAVAVLARRYAGALYELAEGEAILDAVAGDLRAVLDVAESNADFIALANHPRLTRKQLVQAMGAMAASMKLNALTAQFLGMVARHRRLAVIAAMILAFLDKLAASRGEFTASVRAASALTAQQSEQLSTRLAAMAGGKVHLDVREDKSLIGGLTVRLGSRLIDASVKSKLERLERKLKSEAA